jgi:hypothetical protein
MAEQELLRLTIGSKRHVALKIFPFTPLPRQYIDVPLSKKISKPFNGNWTRNFRALSILVVHEWLFWPKVRRGRKALFSRSCHDSANCNSGA